MGLLDSKKFAEKIYEKFPVKYRQDDLENNLALRKFILSAGDGGFSYIIDKTNGLLDLIDPEKTPKSVLPVMYEQYGLTVFNGIPEEYLRHFINSLGEAWENKGSLDVIDYVSTSLSGILTNTQIEYQDNGVVSVDVQLEMDYSLTKYFPDAKQFKRILQNFIPFYCDLVYTYKYNFFENCGLKIKDTSNTSFSTFADENALFGVGKLGEEVLGNEDKTVITYDF